MKNQIIKGYYAKGINNAHKNNNRRKSFFGCYMYGTFNIKLEQEINMSSIVPSLKQKNTSYYLIKLIKDKEEYYGYLIVWKLSAQPKKVVEIVSKVPFPENFKSGIIQIKIFNKWTNEQRDEWAKDMYWWQTFDWSPIKRANSKELSAIINKEINWSGLTVLDIGSHYGYHSFNASKQGAFVTGVEINKSARIKSQIINDYIEMQDVSFYRNTPLGKDYDVILYLSVHHQIDPDYSNLKETIAYYKSRCKKYFIIELILPPMFGKSFSIKEIDDIVGGKILASYQHKVRGIRRLYFIDINKKI